MIGKIVNKTELAAILGRSTRALTTLQAQGLPFVAGGGAGVQNEYDTAAVIDWLICREAKGGLDKETEQAALIREQTQIAKRRNEVEAGDLIPLSSAIEVVRRGVFGIRQKIVNSRLTREEKQALLGELHAMRNIDFAEIPADEEAKETPA